MTAASSRRPFAAARGALAAAALVLAAGPTLAQSVEALTVVGQRSKENAETMSYPVTFRDLDLRSAAGRKELRRRIGITATYICRHLARGERHASADSCRSRAITEAMASARAIEHQARAHGARWTPGPPWTPPPGA